MKDLKHAPFPDYSLFDLDSYLNNDNYRWLFSGKKGLYLMSSRGCPYDCAFCCSGGGIRTYEIRRVKNEIRHMVDRYSLETIFLRDDIFTYDQKRAQDISIVLGEAGMSWVCMTRPNLVCRKGDKQLLHIMVTSGCETIMIGLESYNQRVLDLNLKHVKIAEIDKAIENCQAAGLRVIAFLIFGLQGETEDSIKQTLQFVEKSGIEINSNILQPLPGSMIYDNAVRKGKIIDEVQYLKDFHFFWDTEDYLPVNMTTLPDDTIIQANKEAGRLRKYFP